MRYREKGRPLEVEARRGEPGDWIVTRPFGTKYCLDVEEFHEYYEPVSVNEPPDDEEEEEFVSRIMEAALLQEMAVAAAQEAGFIVSIHWRKGPRKDIPRIPSVKMRRRDPADTILGPED